MPDPNNRTGRDFSLYDAMDDEQLRQILRDDASKPEGEDTDMELMLHIMEVLAKRRKEANQDISPEAALEQFNKKYTYTDNSLISEKRPAKRRTTGFSRWQRWVATIAAMLILVFGSALTAQAFGFDLFEVIAKWTKETFHFGYFSDNGTVEDPSPDRDNPCSSLQEALAKYQIEHKLVPTWVPDGYEDAGVKIKEAPTQRVFTANYKNGDGESIRLRIADYLNTYPVQVEQSGTLVEVISIGERDYYIFDNEGQLQAAWIFERFECYISGSMTLSEIKTMIESIEKG